MLRSAWKDEERRAWKEDLKLWNFHKVGQPLDIWNSKFVPYSYHLHESIFVKKYELTILMEIDIAISVLVSIRTARIISCKMLFINFTLSHNLNGCFDSPNNLVFFLNFFLRYNYYDYYYWCITIIIMITPNK